MDLPWRWQSGGARLHLGYDTGFPVSDDYAPPFAWRGVIHQMTVDTGAGARAAADDVEAALRAD